METEVLPSTERLKVTNELTDFAGKQKVDAIKGDKLLTKNCRRRLKELLAYKLSHRSTMPGQYMLEFEDWVIDQLKPFNMEKILFTDANKERIKLLIVGMKAGIMESLNEGDVDMKFEPKEHAKELDDSDEEWEADKDETQQKQGEHDAASTYTSVVSQQNLEDILNQVKEMNSSVEELVKKSSHTNLDLVKFAEKIEGETQSHLTLFKTDLNQFTTDMGEYVQELGKEYQLAGLVIDNFVADANKGEIANTSTEKEILRQNLLKKADAKEKLLREPGIGRLMLTDEIKRVFNNLKTDSREWAKYKEMDYWGALELYLKKLFMDFRIKEYRRANQLKPLVTYLDAVDEFQQMYIGGVFEMDDGWRYDMEKAWMLFLQCTPGGMSYKDQQIKWMQLLAIEYKKYEEMSKEDKDLFVATRLSETKDQRRKRIEDQIKSVI